MKITRELIKEFEGFKAYPYRCPAGYWTIGYGTRFYPSGVPVKEDDNSIDRHTADMFLNEYLTKHVIPVIERIPFELETSQIEALASLIYNIGADAFEKSKLRQAIIDGDNEQIFRQWDWIRSGKVVLKGLIRRRVAELNYWFNSF